jgi:hypothetical protein
MIYMYMSSYSEIRNVSWLWHIMVMKQQFGITYTVYQTENPNYATLTNKMHIFQINALIRFLTSSACF